MTSASSPRSAKFARNERLEALLRELNTVLGAAERELPLPTQPSFPVVLVVGAPRSGTTLLTQWLAGTGLFAVPTNLLSRFYGAPYLGGRIQRLLTDPAFDYKGELGDIAAYGSAFTSEVGKTKGVLQPNEFWYFWRRFIPNTEPEWIPPELEQRIDATGFLAGVAAIEHAFGKPFATKGIILQYNLRCLQRLFGRVLFVHTRRDPFFNIQSLLRARRDHTGSEETWFSVKPKEFAALATLDPISQVAGQVHYTRTSIDDELDAMDPQYGLTVEHEAFCASPARVFAELQAKLRPLGYHLPGDYDGPTSFDVHARVAVDDATRERITQAYHRLSGIQLRP